jgi:hypothetical protein
MNRFFTAPELADAYRLPKHVHDQLLSELAPVEKDDQGKPDVWAKNWPARFPTARPGRRIGIVSDSATKPTNRKRTVDVNRCQE